jgi:hypothetical protein
LLKENEKNEKQNIELEKKALIAVAENEEMK